MRNPLKIIAGKLSTAKGPAAGQAYLSLKHLRNEIAGRHITFVTFEKLVQLACRWEPELPPADLVVAIPRSGLIVGSIVALRRGLPLATPEEGPWKSALMPSKEMHTILLVDDSVKSGEAMAAARKQVEARYPGAIIITAALIASSESSSLVDYSGCQIEWPRLFEWNFLHSKKFVTAFDIDGVLCVDPEYGLSKDDIRYRTWMREARPKFLPSYEIDAIVSNRPESTRRETEGWLKEHGVRFKELYLAPAEQVGPERKSAHKIGILRGLRPDLYIESDRAASEAIARATMIPVLSIADWKLYD